MLLYGNPKIKKRFRTVSAFTIKIMIRLIIISLTWNLSLVQNMLQGMLKKDWKIQNFIKKLLKISRVQKAEKRAPQLAGHQSTESFEVNSQKRTGEKGLRIVNVLALFVEKTFCHIKRIQYIVQTVVSKKQSLKEGDLNTPVSCVEKNSHLQRGTEDSVPDSARINTCGIPVYNLTVDGGTYFANKVLVHNCAFLAMYVDLVGKICGYAKDQTPFEKRFPRKSVKGDALPEMIIPPAEKRNLQKNSGGRRLVQDGY